MAKLRRAWITPTDSWPELQPLLRFHDQEDYEVIRPVVLFGFTPIEQSQETGISARSIYSPTVCARAGDRRDPVATLQQCSTLAYLEDPPIAIYRRVGRFDESGMQSLFEADPVDDERALPPADRQAIVQIKAE